MARLEDIEKKLSPADPVIRIYRGRCVLNASACRLLGIPGKSQRILVRRDMEQAAAGRDRIYISHSYMATGYVFKMRGNEARINSSSLCLKLAGYLEGPGAYRICPEVSITENGRTWYEIFFKRYD